MSDTGSGEHLFIFVIIEVKLQIEKFMHIIQYNFENEIKIFFCFIVMKYVVIQLKKNMEDFCPLKSSVASS